MNEYRKALQDAKQKIQDAIDNESNELIKAGLIEAKGLIIDMHIEATIKDFNNLFNKMMDGESK